MGDKETMSLFNIQNIVEGNLNRLLYLASPITEGIKTINQLYRQLQSLFPQIPLTVDKEALKHLSSRMHVFISFLLSSLDILSEAKIPLDRLEVCYYKDIEIEGWNYIVVLFRIRSNDYDRLLEVWSKLSKSVPKTLSNVYVEVQPC
ncbi:MAG: hypothetical protein J7L38_03080 [Thermoproteales archaeon]|nr:hypothetical protein [Thermoproteales archaeon]